MYPKSFIRRITRQFGLDVVGGGSEVWLGSNLSYLLKRLRITCVLDVGAHYGEYGTRLREYGYTGRIVSFEPVRTNFERLRERAAKDKSWDVHRLALGDHAGSMDINVTRCSFLDSFLTPRADSARDRPLLSPQDKLVERLETVEVRRLDEVFAQYVSPHLERTFMKIDTQGYDLKVLRGAYGCLDAILALQTEVSVIPIYEGMTDYREAIRIMEELGFELSGLFPVIHDSQLRLVELDCLMIRSSTAQVPAAR